MIARLKESVLRPGVVWLLALTLVLALFAPRALSWWPALLGLVTLPLADRSKQPLWIAATVPLWAGTLSLISTIWAAFPHETLTLATSRLPMLYGFSLGILGLSTLRDDVWKAALPKAAVLFVICVLVAFVEYSFDYPLNHLLFVATGETNLKLETAATMNRALSAMTMFALPCVWVLWQRGHEKTVLFIVLILLGALAVSEASATFLAALVGILIFPLARLHVSSARALLIGGTALVLCFMPYIAPWIFAHRPLDLAYLDNPSTGGRLEIWDFVSHVVQQRPLTGYGYEVTRYYPFETQEIYFKQSTVLHPHNTALQVWIEFGVIGVTLALLGLWGIARNLKTAPDLVFYALTAVMAMLSYGMWQGPWLGLVIVTALYWRAAATSFGSKIQ